jgi:hypothetical protein
MFSTVGNYTLGGTIGQPDAGRLSAGTLVLCGGFWSATAAGCAAVATSIPTNTPTNTPAPTNTPNNTLTPGPGNLAVHVIWQTIPQPNARSILPITLTLKLGTTEINYPQQNTDTSGFFTVSVGSLPAGTYSWRVKGPKEGNNLTPVPQPGFLANCGTVSLTGATQTNLDAGMMKGGDANNDNLINTTDFTILKNDFGHSGADRADFNNDSVVNASDFTILKNNFGQAGCNRLGPGGSQPDR